MQSWDYVVGFFNFLCLNSIILILPSQVEAKYCKSFLLSAVHINKWTWIVATLQSWVTERWVFSELPHVVLLLGHQAYCWLHTCSITKRGHDGSNPTSLLWGGFKFFLKNHKENCKGLEHPHHKHIDLKQSRPKSPSQLVSEPLQRRFSCPAHQYIPVCLALPHAFNILRGGHPLRAPLSTLHENISFPLWGYGIMCQYWTGGPAFEV